MEPLSRAFEQERISKYGTDYIEGSYATGWLRQFGSGIIVTDRGIFVRASREHSENAEEGFFDLVASGNMTVETIDGVLCVNAPEIRIKAYKKLIIDGGEYLNLNAGTVTINATTNAIVNSGMQTSITSTGKLVMNAPRVDETTTTKTTNVAGNYYIDTLGEFQFSQYKPQGSQGDVAFGSYSKYTVGDVVETISGKKQLIVSGLPVSIPVVTVPFTYSETIGVDSSKAAGKNVVVTVGDINTTVAAGSVTTTIAKGSHTTTATAGSIIETAGLGIDMKATKDINATAVGKITTKSTLETQIQSLNKLKMFGTDVGINSTGVLSIKSGAAISISASSQISLTGNFIDLVGVLRSPSFVQVNDVAIGPSGPSTYVAGQIGQMIVGGAVAPNVPTEVTSPTAPAETPAP